ncbi:CPBP family intramembrane glutamic endopeptidase [Corynebacterium kozikiae]|uniref:CPBP family intramembrane glutamic endopeptidase n=1 Tax=Corynebacterium kozikiae TaxID=2968469 RepID=UPI00211CD142|nr:type II CAAX endopeptidase family protein [Corynebacterium sp. 76QC2CO]MCQ9342234.1 CPBP family intramembrane metalloprotease [Corynebacterium sp. 76QC2CO]
MYHNPYLLQPGPQQPQPSAAPPQLPWGKVTLWASLSFAAIAALTVGVVVLTRLAFGDVGDPLTVVALVLFAMPTLMLGALLVILRAFQLRLSDVGYHKPTARLLHLLWQYPLILACMVAVQAVVTSLASDDATTSNTETIAELAVVHPALLLLAFVGIAIATPLFEEIWIRGMLMNWLKLRWGTTAAVVVSALVFAVLHGMIWLMPGLFVAGLGYGLLRVFHRNLWASTIAHAIQNTIASTAAITLLSV